jgi:hypothetical protein
MVGSWCFRPMFYDKFHSNAVQDWYFRMINDSHTFEKFRYIDTINDYNSIIKECQKLLDITPLREQDTRDKIISTLTETKADLKKTRAEYAMYRKYKRRTGISP